MSVDIEPNKRTQGTKIDFIQNLILNFMENKKKLDWNDIEELAADLCNIDTDSENWEEEVETALYDNFEIDIEMFQKLIQSLYDRLNLDFSSISLNAFIGFGNQSLWLLKKDVSNEFIGCVIQFLMDGGEYDENGNGFSKIVTSHEKPEWNLIITKPENEVYITKPLSEFTDRIQISNLKKDAIEKIQKLQSRILELEKEDILFCDKNQWYKEGPETHGTGKRKLTRNYGRIYWKEDFKDEDTGEIITLERSQIVKVDGEWVDYLKGE